MTAESWTLEGFADEQVEVADRATRDAVLDRWDAGAADDPVLVMLAAPGGNQSLAIALGGGEESMLDWIDEEDQTGPYLDSLGPRENDGSELAFKFSNTFSFFNPSVLITKEQARAGVVEFYETGVRPRTIRWQLFPHGYEYRDGRYLNRDGTEVHFGQPSKSEPESTLTEKMAGYEREARHGHGKWVPVDGAWTVYWVVALDQNLFDNAVVGSMAELDALLDRIDVLRRDEFRAGMAEVVSPKGDILGIALGRAQSVLHWIPVGGEPDDDLTSVGSDDAPEGTFKAELPESAATAIVQFPSSALIPMEYAQGAVKQFFETGTLPDGIHWRAL